MISTTGRALIDGSLRLLGVVGDGFVMTNGQAATGLLALNSLIDAWGVQRQTIYTVARSVTSVLSGGASYSIGLTTPASTFPQARPLWIEKAAYVVPGSSPAIEVDLPVITDQAYQDQQMKAQTNSLPTTLYYQPTSGQAGTIILWPILTQTVSIVLYVPVAIAQVDLPTTVILPPGYDRALRYNLAAELVPFYGQVNPTVVQAVVAMAQESLADLKRANQRLSDLSVDAGLLGSNRSGGWDIYVGP